MQLRTFAHDSQHPNINETLIQNINELHEEEVLWYLQKLKEPQWITGSHQDKEK